MDKSSQTVSVTAECTKVSRARAAIGASDETQLLAHAFELTCNHRARAPGYLSGYRLNVADWRDGNYHHNLLSSSIDQDSQSRST
jgi:hypothetical protein